jgi:hypothetical protein
MVHLRISDADGSIEVRQANGTQMGWSRGAWNGRLLVSVQRRPGHKLAIEVSRSGQTSDRPVKSAILTHGQSIVLTSAVELPSNFLGAAGGQVTFTDED